MNYKVVEVQTTVSAHIKTDGKVIGVVQQGDKYSPARVLVEQDQEELGDLPAEFTDADDSDDAEGMKNECGYPTDNGKCGRTVSDPDDYCFQHPGDE